MPRVRGQALVLALVLLVAGAAALLRLFDLGQVVQARAALTHAADATAYSGALTVARALNLQAFINRTQLAHQVAMAHLVTLASASRFIRTESQRASLGNPPVAVIAMLFGPAHGAAYAAARRPDMADDAAQAALQGAFAAHDAIVHEVLWRTQRAVAQDLPVLRQAAMMAVLRANAVAGGLAPDALRLDADFLSDTLAGFLVQADGAARQRLKAVVQDATATYGFLDPRQDTARNAWIVSPRCPWRRHELRRRGSTVLEGLDTWAADDTQSYHALRANRWIGCYYREYPMGWATAGAHGDADREDAPGAAAPTDFSAEDFWRWARANTDWDIVDGKGNPLADAYAGVAPIRWRSRGLPGYVDLARGAGGQREDLRFAFRVWREAAGLPVTGAASRVRVGAGPLAGAARLPQDRLAVVSAAQVFFARPVPRADGMRERPGLFQPYWQARLVPVTAQESALARQRQGAGT